MKSYGDKFFFIVAILVLAASAAYFVSSREAVGEAIDNSLESLNKQAPGATWEPIAIPKLKLETKAWNRVAAQDEEGLWLYQLFTSPKIWVDTDGSFIAEPPFQTEAESKIFGFRFGGVKNDPYPIKYKGFYVDPDGNRTVQLSDETTNRFLKGKINEEIQPLTGKPMKTGIIVKKFDAKSVKQKDGTLKRQTTVTLFDSKLNREIEIYSDKPTFLDESRVMVLNPDVPQTPVWNVKAVGDTIEANGIKYTVKALDFDNETVVIEKQLPKANSQPQVRKLSKDGIEPVK